MKTTKMLAILVLALGLATEVANADFTFGTPTPFDEPVNSTGIEYFDCISADGLEIYIDKPVGGGIGSNNWDLYVSTRETTNDPWSVPVSLGSTVNSSYIDGYSSLPSDGLELYFSGRRPGGYGQQDIWVTTRDSKSADWGTPVNLGTTINTSDYDWLPWITPDGLELYFSSNRPGGYGGSDIWVATRTSTNDEWEEPVNLGPVVNSTIDDCFPCLSPDGLVLFFSDYDNPSSGFRLGGHGSSDMWMTRRKSTADPWESPVNLGPDMNTSYYDSEPRVSPDGSVLYFTSSRPGKLGGFSDIWQVSIEPVVDLNVDGIVDASDMCIMIDNWGTDESLCDIGPTPFGDGIVDVQDLIVLDEHLFEDYRLIAHWELDEIEGGIAYDSVGDNDGTLNGEPVWQPTSGKVGGALEFDGTDDYVSTPFILDPSKGSLSAFAWIKGGSPGQVIISQRDTTVGSSTQLGSAWLWADSSYGRLITRLMHPPFDPLVSESVITDGQWHHVGLVYDFDGLYRYLYVDGVEVAKDTNVVGGVGSDGGLYFGADKALDAGSFFSGLIDDVRIYNRAVIP
ncbi:MAG TPA: LamG-like jellyroll fold domain-containing protein [Sedimentisphaerales bacterium]|nr:LamG-like jellyroll fold domain-containing protein [Sedimentisphaerales bacterium]